MIKIKQFTPFTRPYKRLTGIGERIGNTYLYKYMSLSTACILLQNNTLRFNAPTKWTDPYEKRFFEADYRFVKNSQHVNRKTYACCMAKNRECEAAWRMYSKNYLTDPCVQFVVNVGQLRTFLNQYAESNNWDIYEGEVDYTLNDKEFRSLHLKSSPFHNLFFEDFNIIKYLNLLLIKRQAFEYEGEIRYFLQKGQMDMRKKFVDIQIPWNYCLHKVVVPEKLSPALSSKIEDALKKNEMLCKAKWPNYYERDVPIEESKIYKPFEKITIQ